MEQLACGLFPRGLKIVICSIRSRRTDSRSPVAAGQEPKLRFLACLLFLLTLVALQPACAIKKAYSGHTATDLSGLRPGVMRAEVNRLIGQPERVEQANGMTHAWYVYDRGFTGSLESTSVGEKIFWAPVMVWGEVVSLGTVELMGQCQIPCQKGLLELHYDSEGKLLAAREQVLPDSHPQLKGCATTSVRQDVAVCQGVRELARPPSLQSELSGQ